jgi:hypothetical protein
MGILTKLLKAVIGATLLNKTARYAFIGALIKSVKYVFRPATITNVRSLFSGAEVLSVLAAILLAMMKGRGVSTATSSKNPEDRIIDLDEYTVLDDRH